MIQFKNVNIKIDNKTILHSLNLDIENGDCAVILGANGQGKSTILKAIMGHFDLNTTGEIIYNNNDITHIPVFERARMGIFLANQNPIEIDGISQLEFYKTILSENGHKTSIVNMYKLIEKNLQTINLSNEILLRSLNYNFSGGEKKRNEIMQMLLLNPELILIDEIDSGLDVDALNNIMEIIIEQKKQNKTIIFVSHNIDVIKFLKPNKSFLLANQQIVKNGDYDFAIEVMQKGFKRIYKEYNIPVKQENNSLDVCIGGHFNEQD